MIFFKSAASICDPLTRPNLAVGQRILYAVQSTQTVVSCNTNLGIILLCAPMTQAALHCRTSQAFYSSLKATLAELSIQDAEMTYEAIRLAAPAGLGRVEEQDINNKPTISLRSAMSLSQTQDRIAYQYARNYDDIFTLGLPVFYEALARWDSVLWATVAVYLAMLSHFPDSHIARKYGAKIAEKIRLQATDLSDALKKCYFPTQLLGKLQSMDYDLKKNSINPGTSADLTVATLFAYRLQDIPNAVEF